MALGNYNVLVSYDTTLVRENLLEKVQIRSDKRRDFLNLILNNSMAFKSPYIQVPHKVEHFRRTTLNTGITATTNVAINVVLDNLAVFPVNVKNGSILRIDSEIFEVPSDPVYTSTTITCNLCRRGTGTQMSSIAAAHTAGTVVHIEGAITPENVAFDRSDHVIGTRQVCFTEIIQPYELEISGTAEATSSQTAGGDNDIDYQLRAGLDYQLNLLQDHCIQRIHSNGSLSNSTTTIAESRTMRGLANWITQYNGIDTASSSATITTDHFDTDIETIITRGGLQYADAAGEMLGTGSSLVCLVNETQKTFINRFLGSRMRTTQNESKLVNYVGTYQGAATVDFIIMPSSAVRNSEYFILNPAQMTVAPLQGRAFKMEDLAKTKDGKQKWIVGEYATVVYNPETCARRTGLATT